MGIIVTNNKNLDSSKGRTTWLSCWTSKK
jgi:hypothetical protein